MWFILWFVITDILKSCEKMKEKKPMYTPVSLGLALTKHQTRSVCLHATRATSDYKSSHKSVRMYSCMHEVHVSCTGTGTLH